MKLLETNALHWSPVVANNRMNRKRKATGINSYAQELNFAPYDFLQTRSSLPVRWIDLCCGQGKALLETAQQLNASGHSALLEGWDLVDFYDPIPLQDRQMVQFVTQPLEHWHPQVTYDLITCVHGIHYLGDKLALILKALSFLKPTGKFIAHLDPHSLRASHDPKFGKTVIHWLTQNGLHFQPRKRLLSRTDPLHLNHPWHYLGADDTAGPNYTGQEAVNSWYQSI